MKQTIVIIENGVVTDVLSNVPGMEVTVYDLDDDMVSRDEREALFEKVDNNYTMAHCQYHVLPETSYKNPEEENRVCKRCGHVVELEAEPGLKEQYPYYCPNCDENMYAFETEVVPKGKEIRDLRVDTPRGPVVARLVPSKNFPGIELRYANENSGEPGALMYYNRVRRMVQLNLYERKHPGIEPTHILPMSYGTEDNGTDALSVTYTDQELWLNTPAGPIVAKVFLDEEFPGIQLLYSVEGNGEPGAIMEYLPWRDMVRMHVYTREDPDDSPVMSLPMSADPEWRVDGPDRHTIQKIIREIIHEADAGSLKLDRGITEYEYDPHISIGVSYETLDEMYGLTHGFVFNIFFYGEYINIDGAYQKTNDGFIGIHTGERIEEALAKEISLRSRAAND